MVQKVSHQVFHQILADSTLSLTFSDTNLQVSHFKHVACEIPVFNTDTNI